MNKQLMLLLTFVILISTSAYAIDGYSELNLSNVNESFALDLNITLIENETLYIQPYNVSSKLNYSYPSQLNFTNATETLQMIITSNSTFPEDEIINSIFNLSNSFNNNSYLYNVTTNITADPLFYTKRGLFIDMDDGDYYVNVSTDLINTPMQLAYRVDGLEGEKLEILCVEDSWVDCPKSRIFDNMNSTHFNINYTIPDNVLLGEKTFELQFKTGDLLLDRNITFNIYEPDIILKNYVFEDRCFDEDSNGDITMTYDCILEYQQYQNEQMLQVIEKLREARASNCENAENNTELVYIGNVKEEVFDMLTVCRDDRDSCRSSLSDSQETVNKKEILLKSCQSDLKISDKKLNDEEGECLQNVFSTSVKLKADAEFERNETMYMAKVYRKKTIAWNVGIIIFAVLVLFIAIWIKLAKKENWSQW